MVTLIRLANASQGERVRVEENGHFTLKEVVKLFPGFISLR
jgi:hypothetical protein